MSATFELKFEGSEADGSVLDFYDLSQALIGFQRSLALTTHAILNDEVITQAPALKGARILATVPDEGSWKITAAVIFGGHLLLQANSIPRETPLGNIIYSAYDYVISEALGFHVDFKSTIGEQLDTYRRTHPDQKVPHQSRLDGVIEKAQNAIKEMHRPIVKSQSATHAIVTASPNLKPVELEAFTEETFEYINFTDTSETPERISGKISSYNINTFTGRVYDLDEMRTIYFMLSSSLRNRNSSYIIAESMSLNISDDNIDDGVVEMVVFRNRSRSGRTKSYSVVAIERVNRRL